MESEGESIRRAVRARKKQSYSPELKARIVAYVEQRRAAGFSQRVVSEEVGVKWTTLRRWVSKTPTTALVPVAVRPSAPTRTVELSLVTPSGYRLEGLDAPDAVALFRAL
jgi:transposase-like protein